MSRKLAMTISGSASQGTGHSRTDPRARGGDEIVMRERGQSPWCAVDPVAGLESPTNERLFFVVLDESRAVETVVLRPIGDGPADVAAGQDVVAPVLALHRP